MINKLRKRSYIQYLSLLFFSTILSLFSNAQEISYIRPEVTERLKMYKRQVRADSNKRMVELKKMIPGIVYDLRYATRNNFMHRPMYPEKTKITFLRLAVAKNLQKIQSELNEKGYGLKIYDAYRPYSVTVKFWELVRDEKYVANPSKGSGHNRGIAVDLTIINLFNGKEIAMGTDFDNFSDTSHHSFSELAKEIIFNRLLLKNVMEKYGFKSYDNEWWHYFIPETDKFEILDINFKKLKKYL